MGLHKWKQGSNPWEQHALHMPACPLVQSKGHNFAQLAAEVPVSSHNLQVEHNESKGYGVKSMTIPMKYCC